MNLKSIAEICSQCAHLKSPFPSQCIRLISSFCGAHDLCPNCSPILNGRCDEEIHVFFQSICENHGSTIESEPQINAFYRFDDGHQMWILVCSAVLSVCLCCCIIFQVRRSRQRRNAQANDLLKLHADILLDSHDFSWQCGQIHDNRREGFIASGFAPSEGSLIYGFDNPPRPKEVRFAPRRVCTETRQKRKEKVQEILAKHRKKRREIRKRGKLSREEVVRFQRESTGDMSISAATISLLSEDTPRATNPNSFAMSSIFDRQFPSLPPEPLEASVTIKKQKKMLNTMKKASSNPISESTVDFLLGDSAIGGSSFQNQVSSGTQISSSTVAFLNGGSSKLKRDFSSGPSLLFPKQQVVPPQRPDVFSTETGILRKVKPVHQEKRVSFADMKFTEKSKEVSSLEQILKKAQKEVLVPKVNHTLQEDIASRISTTLAKPQQRSPPPKKTSRSQNINIQIESEVDETSEETQVVHHTELNYFNWNNNSEESLIVSISRNNVARKFDSNKGSDVIHSPAQFQEQSRRSKKRSRTPSETDITIVSSSTESQRKKRRTCSNSIHSSRSPQMAGSVGGDRDLSAGGSAISDSVSIFSNISSFGGSSVPLESGIIGPPSIQKRFRKKYEIPRPGHGKKLGSKISDAIYKRGSPDIQDQVIAYENLVDQQRGPTRAAKSKILTGASNGARELSYYKLLGHFSNDTWSPQHLRVPSHRKKDLTTDESANLRNKSYPGLIHKFYAEENLECAKVQGDSYLAAGSRMERLQDSVDISISDQFESRDRSESGMAPLQRENAFDDLELQQQIRTTFGRRDSLFSEESSVFDDETIAAFFEDTTDSLPVRLSSNVQI